MLEVWKLCRRSSMGAVGHLPEGGGVLEQPAIIMQALEVCNDAEAWVEEFIPRPKERRPDRRDGDRRRRHGH